MTPGVILIWALMAVLGLTAVGGLVWAVRRGQLGDLQNGARVIFDEEEPEGVMTDSFPGEARQRPVEDER